MPLSLRSSFHCCPCTKGLLQGSTRERAGEESQSCKLSRGLCGNHSTGVPGRFPFGTTQGASLRAAWGKHLHPFTCLGGVHVSGEIACLRVGEGHVQIQPGPTEGPVYLTCETGPRVGGLDPALGLLHLCTCAPTGVILDFCPSVSCLNLHPLPCTTCCIVQG